MRIKIPKYAKIRASSALELRRKLPKSKKFGLDKKQAEKIKINSGVERAKKIIRNKYLSREDARSVAKFIRFKNCKTKKCKRALDLWGGKRFVTKVYKEVYGKK